MVILGFCSFVLPVLDNADGPPEQNTSARLSQTLSEQSSSSHDTDTEPLSPAVVGVPQKTCFLPHSWKRPCVMTQEQNIRHLMLSAFYFNSPTSRHCFCSLQCVTCIQVTLIARYRQRAACQPQSERARNRPEWTRQSSRLTHRQEMTSLSSFIDFVPLVSGDSAFCRCDDVTVPVYMYRTLHMSGGERRTYMSGSF